MSDNENRIEDEIFPDYNIVQNILILMEVYGDLDTQKKTK
jgi:hypothetical protein